MHTPNRLSRLLAPVVIAAMAVLGPALQADKDKSAVPAKPDDKTILHVLNRIGFGPGPATWIGFARWAWRNTSISSCIRSVCRMRR